MRLSQALSLWSEELTQVALGSFWNLRTAEASNKLKKDCQQTTGDVAIQYASLCNSDILCIYMNYISSWDSIIFAGSWWLQHLMTSFCFFPTPFLFLFFFGTLPTYELILMPGSYFWLSKNLCFDLSQFCQGIATQPDQLPTCATEDSAVSSTCGTSIDKNSLSRYRDYSSSAQSLLKRLMY